MKTLLRILLFAAAAVVLELFNLWYARRYGDAGIKFKLMPKVTLD